ncbi:MAG: MarR family transcriptional regulator [Chthoniobacteraceae bacterium]|nr:MarR family transcriptional regulator [Chthoniobacteraceae bacterium]MDB6171562.1 MarR family transcriptional regulator [Chthoniobacteraceae bacterium]
MSNPVPDADYEMLADFRYALRQFLRFSEEAAREAGLTPHQHQALLAVRGFRGRDKITIGELSERLQIRPHSAVGLVDRLSGQKLLIRESGIEDRRQVYVRITERGAELLEKLAAVHQSELKRVGPRLGSLLHQLIGND